MSIRLRILICLLILLSSVFDNAYSQPRQQDKLTIIIEARVIELNGHFQYDYKVLNRNDSEQDLENLIIGTGEFVDINDVKSPQTGKWSAWHSYLEISTDPTKTMKTVEWVASYDSIRSINDTYSPPNSVVGPGESSKFSFSSNGLPSIKKFWGRGWVTPYMESEYDSLIIVGYEPEELSPPWYKDAFENTTIAPVLPDPNASPTISLSKLSDYLSQSCTDLGWISNQGICRSLEVKLGNVQRQLDRGNTNAATGSLQAFLNELEALKDKQISSEAYALLYFNGQYLLDQLN